MTDSLEVQSDIAIVLAEAELLVWLAAEPIAMRGTAADYAMHIGVDSVDPWLFDCVIQGLRHNGFIKAPELVHPDRTHSPTAYLLLELRTPVC